MLTLPALVQAVVLLIVLGVVLYLIESIPMDAMIKVVIRVLVVLALCLYLLRVVGLL